MRARDYVEKLSLKQILEIVRSYEDNGRSLKFPFDSPVFLHALEWSKLDNKREHNTFEPVSSMVAECYRNLALRYMDVLERLITDVEHEN